MQGSWSVKKRRNRTKPCKAQCFLFLCLRLNPALGLPVRLGPLESGARSDLDPRLVGISLADSILSLASGEWAAAMCNAKENGILAPQIGQNLGSERGDGSLTVAMSVGVTPQASNLLGVHRGSSADRLGLIPEEDRDHGEAIDIGVVPVTGGKHTPLALALRGA